MSKQDTGRSVGWLALFVLTGINLLNYIDRYVFSALLPAIKRDLGFTDTELGLLGSGFIFAYLVISPVFGFLGDRGGRSRVMAAGVTVWSAATAFSGFTMSFMGQMVTRVAVGLGESAYSVIAPSTLADYFPKSTRGRIFAIYSGAIPVGSALGYLLGGLLEPVVGWRHSFFVVGGPGVLLAAILFFMRDPRRGEADEVPGQTESAEKPPRLKASYKLLIFNGGFMATVIGYAAYTFVVGGMAFWMPTFIVRYFDVTLTKANTVFGSVTVVGGFLGTLIGGWWSDRVEKTAGNGFLKISVWSMLLATPLFLLTLEARDFNSFTALLFVTEIALFLCMSPLDAAVLGYVRPSLRATAMALNVLLIHLLGDGISRALMGAVSDASGLRAAIGLLPWVLLIAGVIWQFGIILYWQAIPWPAGALTLPKWQAHRGFRPTPEVRENTLDAFRRARSAGATMLECDVHLTKDGEVVIFHDEDLKRIAGDDRFVSEMTYAEMRELTGAPKLSELLADPAAPQLLNIELKNGQARGNGAFEKAVLAVVRKAHAEGRVLFSSFNPFCLRRLSKLAPDIPRALLASEFPEKRNAIYLRKLWLASFARPHLLHLDQEMLTTERIRTWKERGVSVVAWTVNDLAVANRLLAEGVQSIITDRLYAEER